MNNNIVKSMDYNIIKSIRDKYIFLPSKLNKEFRKSKNLFFIKNKNNKLLSYFIYFPKTNNKYLIIWSHENKSNAYDNSEFFQNLSNILESTIVIYDYQGYGFSKGTANEANCYKDLELTINHFKKEYGLSGKNIYLVGHGFGTGVVIEYISKNDWHSPVILISPFKSIFCIAQSLDIYKIVFNLARQYVDLDSIDVFKSFEKINKVKCPVKIIHGQDNDFIKIKQAKDLYDKLPNKIFGPLWIQKCGHFDILEKIDFKQIFDEIINKTSN